MGIIIQDRNKRISSDETFIDELEFLALISIVYMMSTTQENNLSLIDMCFNTNRGSFYKRTMARIRFLQILKYLRFHDGTDRMERRTMDKFATTRIYWKW